MGMNQHLAVYKTFPHAYYFNRGTKQSEGSPGSWRFAIGLDVNPLVIGSWGWGRVLDGRGTQEALSSLSLPSSKLASLQPVEYQSPWFLT